MDQIVGIYQIENVQNQRRYIGSSDNVQRRWRVHLSHLRKGKHHSPRLQQDYAVMGEAVFTFRLVETVSDPRNLKAREQWWIDSTDCCTDGYNTCPIAASPMAGRKHSPETIKKFKSRVARKGWHWTPEQRAMLSKAHKGKKLKRSTRHKMSLAHKGNSLSAETRKRISDSVKNTFAKQRFETGSVKGHRYKLGHEQGMTGKRHSAETKAKIAEATRRRWENPAGREKLLLSMRP